MEFLLSIPLYWAKILAALLFTAIGIFALLMPKEFILKDCPGKERWRDLRIWAAVLMVSQIIIYLIF